MQQKNLSQGPVHFSSEMQSRPKTPERPKTPKTKSSIKAPRSEEGHIGISLPTYGEDLIQSDNRNNNFIEVRTFLPTIGEKTISGRYESPLKSFKISASRWKTFTIMLAIFSFCYFTLHLWVTINLTGYNTNSAPRAILEVSSLLVKFRDMLFYNYTMNIVMDCWAIMIYLFLIVILLRENFTKIDAEEQSRFEKIASKTIALAVLLFALSYILGTVLVVWKTPNEVGANPLAILIAFHLIKMIYLLLNFIAFRKYKSKKFIYEDLLIEALGPSDAGEKSQSVEENDD